MGILKESKFNLHNKYQPGPTNQITDVPGVKVGHVTLDHEKEKTGVTAILPHDGNLFQEKVMANAHVLNGFGKSIGILQVQELGSIETPILMTNTMSIGTAYTALCKYMMQQNPDIGCTTGTVNCLVTECNDGRLNDIRGMHIKEEHIYQAIQNAADSFEEGAVGAGTGMCCLGFKGGIGSASRQIEVDDTTYIIGALVLTNFGAAGNLVIGGTRYEETTPSTHSMQKDQGSIIIVIATNLPLSERQLGRICKRAAISLGRTGSYMGNGSGDIAIAFTTANKIQHNPSKAMQTYQTIHDNAMDSIFEASVEAIEESIISALYHAKTTIGVRGNTVYGLKDIL